MPSGYRLQITKGDRYGLLTIIREVESRGRIRCFLCLCECGSQKIVRLNHLRSKLTRSCGCLVGDTARQLKMKHGGAYSRLYKIWSGMLQRCNNPNNPSWSYYGGRSIRVSADWRDFSIFRSWATANGYQDNLTIDRIDNDGDYEPMNCRWASRKQQSNNNRHSRFIEFRGQARTLTEWAEETGIAVTTLHRRIAKGWPVDKALMMPVGAKR